LLNSYLNNNFNLDSIFSSKITQNFEEIVFKVFLFQYNNNLIYQSFSNFLNKKPTSIKKIEEIPFLPISLFKTQKILSTNKYEKYFISSGTTFKHKQSYHYVYSLKIYEKSFTTAFNLFYDNYLDYVWIALLPNNTERPNSSLVYMINYFIKNSKHKESNFYLNNFQKAYENILKCFNENKKVILFGVSYALIDFAEKYTLPKYDNLIVMETGGMKGKRREILREELHEYLCKRFNTSVIHSEYGMTEILTQSYSKGNGLFYAPPWMKILIRNLTEPFDVNLYEQYGGINIIDLANIYSCSFIATDDLGIKFKDESFKVLGRIDFTDERGCNLLY